MSYYQEKLNLLLKYNSIGWVVFPLRPIIKSESGPLCACGNATCPGVGKHPAVKWTELREGGRCAQIEEWHSREPGAGWAIHLGPSGLCVVDVDPRNGGNEGLQSLIEAVGSPFPSTLTATTGGGGLHIYLEDPGTLPACTKIDLAPGVELLSGQHIAIIPPSPHKLGKRYRWFDMSEPAPIPSTFLDFVHAKYVSSGAAEKDRKAQELAKLARSAGSLTSINADDLSVVQKRARKYLDQLPPAIQGQNGSKITYRAACVLVVDFALSPSDAYPLLAEYSDRCLPPWSENELWHKLHSADKETGLRGRFLERDSRSFFDEDEKWMEKIDREMLDGLRRGLKKASAFSGIVSEIVSDSGSDGASLIEDYSIVSVIPGTEASLEENKAGKSKSNPVNSEPDAATEAREKATREEHARVGHLARGNGCGLSRLLGSAARGEGSHICVYCGRWNGCDYCREMNKGAWDEKLSECFRKAGATGSLYSTTCPVKKSAIRAIRQRIKRSVKKKIVEWGRLRHPDRLKDSTDRQAFAWLHTHYEWIRRPRHKFIRKPKIESPTDMVIRIEFNNRERARRSSWREQSVKEIGCSGEYVVIIQQGTAVVIADAEFVDSTPRTANAATNVMKAALEGIPYAPIFDEQDRKSDKKPRWRPVSSSEGWGMAREESGDSTIIAEKADSAAYLALFQAIPGVKIDFRKKRSRSADRNWRFTLPRKYNTKPAWERLKLWLKAVPEMDEFGTMPSVVDLFQDPPTVIVPDMNLNVRQTVDEFSVQLSI